MEWIFLVIAGGLEVFWSTCMKYSEGFTDLKFSILTIIGMIFSFLFLSQATKSLPLGTAYAVWTGIGALGAVIVGIVLFREPVTAARIFFVSLLLIYLGAVFAGIGGGFIGPLAYGIQADNTMYVQYKTGKRAEAAVASLSSFVSKAAQGVAGAIPGYMLAATGFIGGAAQQPQSVEGGIIFCSIMLPLILCAAAGLVFGTLYPLGKKEVDEITLAIEQGVSTK